MSNMSDSNPFETHLRLMRGNSAAKPHRDAAIVVHDTFYTAWASVRTVLGERAAPMHAIELTKLMLDEERRNKDPLSRSNKCMADATNEFLAQRQAQREAEGPAERVGPRVRRLQRIQLGSTNEDGDNELYEF